MRVARSLSILAALTLGCIEDNASDATDAADAGSSPDAAPTDGAGGEGGGPSAPPDGSGEGGEGGEGGDGGADGGGPEAPPCLSVDPAQVEFPPTQPGTELALAVVLSNCGAVPVVLEGLRLTDDSSPAFTLQLVGRPGALEPGQALEVPIAFRPEDEEAHAGHLVVDSDAEPSELRVPLVGRGQHGACPEARVAEAEVVAAPLDIIELDASPSAESAVEYRWILVDRPPGSTARVVERYRNVARPADGGDDDDASTPRAFFFVNLPGTYLLELVVVDAHGRRSNDEACGRPATTLRIDARPAEDIHIQLVWDTPANPDQTDGDGADLDLHFMHPAGRAWMLAPLDCYYANVQPDWGPPGPPANPILAVDDATGAGPEIMTLDDPEDTQGGMYRVGVHYYRANRFMGDGGHWGPSEATVRVHLADGQVGEWTRVLEETDNFWEVVGIAWDGERFELVEIDRLHPQVP